MSGVKAHLFADIRGYGRMAEEKGETGAAKLLRAFARLVRRALPPRGVLVDQIADSFYVVFDSVPEGVRTAIVIADALSRHNRAHPELRLPVSIGIDAGQTIRHSGGHAGPPPVAAKRLTNKARPGQVLVSEAVAALLRTAKVPMRDLGISRLRDGQLMHIYEVRPPDATAEGPPRIERSLATLLFTDIVQSTATAAGRGDGGWREMFERHHAIVREELRRCGGIEIDTAGDGFYATVDTPSRAIECALSIRDRVKDEVGIDIRAGIHVGECEMVAGKIGGIGVVLGGRIRDLGGPGDVLVSQTVRDLVLGSAISFKERGRVALKGVPGEWTLLEVVAAGSGPRVSSTGL